MSLYYKGVFEYSDYDVPILTYVNSERAREKT